MVFGIWMKSRRVKMVKTLLVVFISILTLNVFAAEDLHFKLNTGVSNQKIFFTADLIFWENNRFQMQEFAPGQYELTIPKPWKHQIDYKFIVDNQWTSDPLNPNQSPDGYGGINSYLDLDFFEDPNLNKLPEDMISWRVNETSFKDNEGDIRQLYLAYPGSLNDERFKNKRRVVVYFQDGLDYLYQTNVLNLFARLSVQPDMPLFYGVFIKPKAREREYGLTDLESSERYVSFITETAVPISEQIFGIRVTAQDRLMMGPSLGAVISLYTGLRHPEVFPQVAAQSIAKENSEDVLMPLLKAAPAKTVKLYMTTGFYEHPKWTQFAKQIHGAASESNQEYFFAEYPSSHEWIVWRNQLGNIFSYFFRK
jgi:enterochelin esterase family protein